jgi:hypothetical protein
MSTNTPQEQISRKRVVYSMSAVDAVVIRRDVEYRAAGDQRLGIDFYYPPGMTTGVAAPAVIFVTGFSDAGAQKALGCRFKEMGAYISWAQLAAASGIIGITYENRDPARDVIDVLHYVRAHAATLDIDEHWMGLWACSGHVPNALSVLMDSAQNDLKCAALLYGYMLDVDGSAVVASAARQTGFVNANAGKFVDDLPRHVPLFIARAGHDQMPGLNDALDRFVAHALRCNLPLTCVTDPDAPHAFDLVADTETSREIIRQVLGFLQFHLVRQRTIVVPETR